jgi:hypothetical protein
MFLTFVREVLLYAQNDNPLETPEQLRNKLEQIAEEQRIVENLKRLNTNNSSWLCEEPLRYER